MRPPGRTTRHRRLLPSPRGLCEHGSRTPSRPKTISGQTAAGDKQDPGHERPSADYRASYEMNTWVARATDRPVVTGD
jgi:hypothetical protein